MVLGRAGRVKSGGMSVCEGMCPGCVCVGVVDVGRENVWG